MLMMAKDYPKQTEEGSSKPTYLSQLSAVIS